MAAVAVATSVATNTSEWKNTMSSQPIFFFNKSYPVYSTRSLCSVYSTWWCVVPPALVPFYILPGIMPRLDPPD